MVGSVGQRINDIRDQWHTKKHPFFTSMLDGSLDLNWARKNGISEFVVPRNNCGGKYCTKRDGNEIL